MAALANGDATLNQALQVLHDQFEQAPLLGSLLEVGARDLLDAVLRERGETALASLRSTEPEKAEGAVAARGLFDATILLSRRYVLVATNVPFLGYRDMSSDLLSWAARERPSTKGDLGYCMWDRSFDISRKSGTVAVVTLQHWMSAVSYSTFRSELLTKKNIHHIAFLGAGAFEAITGEKVNITLTIASNSAPIEEAEIKVFDVGEERGASRKRAMLPSALAFAIKQSDQLRSPAHTIALSLREVSAVLGDYSRCFTGIMNGDTPRFTRCFWEVESIKPMWAYLQSTTERGAFCGGFTHIIYYDEKNGHLREDAEVRRAKLHNSDERGNSAWNKHGVAINQMADLSANLYFGNKYDANIAVILPNSEDCYLPILAFAASEEFSQVVRSIDRKMNVMGGTINRVPFDIERWRVIAASKYSKGVPEPESDDPTQWLFHGHPSFALEGTQLHVALARVAGYRWPAETDASMRLAERVKQRAACASALPSADPDGLLPLHATGTNRSLADRIRALLNAAYDAHITPAREVELVRAADKMLDKKEAREATLEDWLRDRAFRQHCVLFHQRPFLWHVWDGGKGGFSVFLYYHRLTRAALEKLTYTLLGDWTVRMKAEGRTAEEGWALQLRQRLMAVLDGEKPNDIFVRWKPFGRQPLGWEPDLDDGVRLNLRPFIEAGVLREVPKGINWNKDRGTDSPSAPWFDLGPMVKDKDGKPGKPGDRINDYHLTLADKRAARQKAAE